MPAEAGRGRPARLPAQEPRSLDAAAEALFDGAMVGLPTETVYGLAVLPHAEALEALVTAKGRDPGKGIPLLVDAIEQVEGLLEVGPLARRLAERFWPGPLTLALPLRDPGVGKVLEVLSGGRGSLAVRLPDHHVPRALARRLGPIAVSSANRSGEPEARTADELLEALGDAIALVIDDGPVRGGVPSSVVALDERGGLTILREGTIRRAELESVLAGR